MAATIKDVAKKANVSISTVSRVLSNQMHVSSSTYKRIQDAVAELNYIPNSSAVSLVKRNSTAVLYADSFLQGTPSRESPYVRQYLGSSHELRKKDIFSAYWIWIVPKKKPKSRSSTPYNLKKQMAF
ncbi:MAG: LacI family DNA-binding transcriptional regulator [Waltera sp.]